MLFFCSYHISAILSSPSPSPSSVVFAAAASLSPQVFVNGEALQPSSDGRWVLTCSRFSRSFVRVELFGVLYSTVAAPAFSIAPNSNVSMLPVRIYFSVPLCLQAVLHAHSLQVIFNGVLVSSNSTGGAKNVQPLYLPLFPTHPSFLHITLMLHTALHITPGRRHPALRCCYRQSQPCLGRCKPYTGQRRAAVSFIHLAAAASRSSNHTHANVVPRRICNAVCQHVHKQVSSLSVLCIQAFVVIIWLIVSSAACTSQVLLRRAQVLLCSMFKDCCSRCNSSIQSRCYFSRLHSLLLPTFTWCSLAASEAATPSPVSPLITQTAAPGQRCLLLQCVH